MKTKINVCLALMLLLIMTPNWDKIISALLILLVAGIIGRLIGLPISNLIWIPAGLVGIGLFFGCLQVVLEGRRR